MNVSNDLTVSFLELISTPDLPGLGPGVRNTVEQPSELNAKVRDWSHTRHLNAELIDLLRSAALLWHDHLDASHSISQSIPSATGSFLHGIMHRREPDYGNSKYWFHRVGTHPAYAEIAKQILTQPFGEDVAPNLNSLIKSSEWDPFGFVDLVSRELADAADQSSIEELQRIQEIEFQCLVRSFFEV